MMYTNTAIYASAGAAPPAATPLLDAVGQGAIVALGFKKLRAAYSGFCIRVRNTNTEAILDIGFDGSGDLDEAAIAAHCGIYNGTIAVWYDQSGNGFNFTPLLTPNAGNSSNEPLIYDGTTLTTDARGNVAADSAVTVGGGSTTGTRFLNSPTLLDRVSPTITLMGQVNTPNGTGMMMTEQQNGYNMGSYNGLGTQLNMVRSNGTTLTTKNGIATNRTDPWCSTQFFYINGGLENSKWWITSELNNATFQNAFTLSSGDYNTTPYNNCTIFRYYSGVLYQNCNLSSYIYWNLPDNTTLSSTELFDLYDWVETNMGYTNNAP